MNYKKLHFIHHCNIFNLKRFLFLKIVNKKNERNIEINTNCLRG